MSAGSENAALFKRLMKIHSNPPIVPMALKETKNTHLMLLSFQSWEKWNKSVKISNKTEPRTKKLEQNHKIYNLPWASMAQIHKGGLFQTCGLFKSMDYNKREISVSCPCARQRLQLSRFEANFQKSPTLPLDFAFFLLKLCACFVCFSY